MLLTALSFIPIVSPASHESSLWCKFPIHSFFSPSRLKNPSFVSHVRSSSQSSFRSHAFSPHLKKPLPILRILSPNLASSHFTLHFLISRILSPSRVFSPCLSDPFRIFDTSPVSYPRFQNPLITHRISRIHSPSLASSPRLSASSPRISRSLCLPHHFPVFRSLSPSLASPPCPTHPSSSEESFPCLTNPLRVSRIFSRS